ncbi:MAG: hypothetical protein V3U87_06795 [Methylococcaceae bacterium]
MSVKKRISAKYRKDKKTSQAKKKQRNRNLKIGIWEQLLNSKVKDVEFPGGPTRKSYRLHLIDGRSVIATERRERSLLAIECAVLRKIGKNSSAVPKLLATDGNYLLVQEDLKGVRLPQALHDANEKQVESLLDNALKSLSTIQKIGSENGLDEQFQPIGNSQEWITGLIDRPAIIGRHFQIHPAQPKVDKLFDLFTVSKQRFVKWDARPGNAIVQEQDNVSWFDWEHCGTRNRLDDLAWLLCDEFVLDSVEMENRLINNNLELFSDHFSLDHAREYLYSFGVFHSCVRLGLILNYKGRGSWWDLDKCLSGDKAGVTLDLAERICYRASRWAKQSEFTEVLSPWFIEMAENLKLNTTPKKTHKGRPMANQVEQNYNDTKQPFWLEQIFDKVKLLPLQGDFQLHGLKINIHSYDPETYGWIEKYIYPLNLLSEDDEPKTNYSVNVFHSDDLVQAVLNSIENSEVDTHKISNARRYVDRISVNGHVTVDCDPSYGMLWVTDRTNNSITLVLSVKVRWPLLEISRVVRDLITRFLEDQGWVIFHAGAVQINKKNYMVVGDASAGKTSFIIALLSSGASFISNERVFVKVENGKNRIISFPMPIAVGLGTMAQYPELIKYVREPQLCLYPPRRINFSRVHNTPERMWPKLEDKVQFLPQEITEKFSDSAGVAEGEIEGVIVPNFQKSWPLKVDPLNKEAIQKVVKNNHINRDFDEIYPPWMPLPFKQPSIDTIKNTISSLTELPSIKVRFSASKNQRNETSTYPDQVEEGFKEWKKRIEKSTSKKLEE